VCRHLSVRSRNGIRQLVGALDLTDQLAAAVGLGNVVERVAHQSFGNVFRAFKQATDLQVDASAQLLDVNFGWQGTFGKCSQHAGRDPPESACGGKFLRGFDATRDVEHLAHAAQILRVAQPREQAALEARPLGLQQLLQLATGQGLSSSPSRRA
jgi:hypothetical protein